ncbi:hypothetical protein ACP4OV_020997 [Aristida adscensionis]
MARQSASTTLAAIATVLLLLLASHAAPVAHCARHSSAVHAVRAAPAAAKRLAVVVRDTSPGPSHPGGHANHPPVVADAGP